MKTVIVLGVGIGLGVIGLLAFQNPAQVKKTGKVAIEAAEVKVESVSHDLCVRRFLDETSCYQKQPQAICAKEIASRCGE